MGLGFYIMLVVTTENEINEYDISRGSMEKVRNA